ncbi:MAG: LysR family transcriptional regulator [Lachnospiraceae bacterium]|nr:LysR family transcriptional regulator [Lachnospiraceae bacterium]
MNVRQLRYLTAIHEYKSLSLAASSLGISQPALSKYLTELERELGTELFFRYKKKLLPTPAGSIYLKAAEEIISVKEQTYQTISEMKHGYRGTITVGVSPLRGTVSIAHSFPAFRRRYPDINLVLREGYTQELRNAVLDHKVDLALGTCLDLEEDGFRYISCHTEEPVLFVPSFHPLAKKAGPDLNKLKTVDLREFADTPFLLSSEGSTYRRLTDKLFADCGIHPTVVYESKNNLLLRHMAESGAGVVILGNSQIVESDSLVYFRIRPTQLISVAVITAQDVPLTDAVRYLTALTLSAEFSEKNYQYRSDPLAEEILKEFGLFPGQK